MYVTNSALNQASNSAKKPIARLSELCLLLVVTIWAPVEVPSRADRAASHAVQGQQLLEH
jgi:hypothetical protein